MTAAERASRTDEADALCLRAYAESAGPDSGVALVAVGGVILAKRVWQAVGPRLVLLCEAVSRRMFSWLPARFTP